MVSAPLSLDDYQLRLPAFEGPLDVLLRLIERDQLDISEVSLIAVFDQFIAFTRELDNPPPRVIAEFVAVAGRLAVLKSRALLPRPPKVVDEGDEPDLVRQLEEYRAVRAAATLLAQRQRSGAGAFGRGESVASPPPAPLKLMTQQPGVLASAVDRWLRRRPAKPALVALQPVVTLREMIDRIATALHRHRDVSFATVRETCASRQDVAVAFLATLLLIRRQAIVASQATLFGPITLSRIDPAVQVSPDRDAPREGMDVLAEDHEYR
jgi:segregation and condensation protein A